MDHAVPMRLVERVGDLHRVLERLVWRDWSAGDTGGECLAVQQLHDEEIDFFALTRSSANGAKAADVVKHADVRMVQLRDRPGFAIESPARVFVGGRGRVQHLERNVAPEPRITCLVDLAHSACAERGEDFVGTQAGASGKRHGGVSIRLERLRRVNPLGAWSGPMDVDQTWRDFVGTSFAVGNAGDGYGPIVATMLAQ